MNGWRQIGANKQGRAVNHFESGEFVIQKEIREGFKSFIVEIQEPHF